MSTTIISEEAMKYNSVIATQNALIELGRQEQLEKNMLEQIKLDNDAIIAILKFEIDNLNLNQTKNITYVKKDIYNTINESLKHIWQLNIIIQDEKFKYIKLQRENYELEKENKELIQETEDLEKNNEEHWNKRVENLRDKCIKKNKTIKILTYCILFAFVNICFISYFGFLRYYYIVAIIIFNTFNFLYYILYLICRNTYGMIYLFNLHGISFLYSGYKYHYNMLSILYKYYMQKNTYNIPDLGVNTSNMCLIID